MEEESKFLHHAPCPNPDCGSSDAYAVYDDGHGYCHVCGRWDKVAAVDGEAVESEAPAPKKKTPVDFLKGEFKALGVRRISKEACEKYGYRVGAKYDGTKVHIAEYHHKGEVVAQHLRDPEKNFAWIGNSKHMELFGQHLWRVGGKRITITEGEIDCLTIAMAFGLKWPVVSLPNGAQSAEKYLKQNLEFLESYQEIVLAFDDDEPGRAAVEKCAMLFSPGKVRVMSYMGHKDANELMVEKGIQAVTSASWEAKPYRPDGIVSGADLWEEIEKDPEPGVDIPYPKLNEMIRGIRSKELYLFTAGSGIGKSTLVRELAYHLNMVHKWPLGIMALEESKKRSGEGMMGIYLNKPIHISREGVFKETLRDAFEKTVGNGTVWLYDHFGSTQIDNLLAKLRYMVVACGVKCIMLDHISIVVSGLDEVSDDERRTIDKLMTRLRTLVEETGVTILAIVHLKRAGDKGKSFNEGRRPSLTDLRGSASLEQLSDVVIALGRDQQGDEPDRSTIYVLKNRPIGITGEADALLYHHDTGRLLVAPERDEPEERDEFAEGGRDF